MGKLIFITGGARSGKSSFAERYAAKYGKNIAYIATAQIYDKEMELRVQLHKQRRPNNWTTYEAPFETEKAVIEASRNHDMILLDCLTVYTSNLLLEIEWKMTIEERFRAVMEKMDKLLAAVKMVDCNLVFVSNEVGDGIVPDNALAREYRDLAGSVNQKFARAADKVFMVVSGIPVDIKKLETTLEE